MLAVISNLAPLYTRGAAGDSILRAGSEVEMLANAVAAKLQSKAESVRVISETGETLGQSRFVTLPQAVPLETTHATATKG
jgi:hypothetical protein